MFRPRRLRLIVVLACLASLAAAGTARATYPGVNGRIAFSQGVQVPDGGELAEASQVFTVEPNGSGLVQLTHVQKGVAAALPSWSPDGRRIAYESNASGVYGIWTMNADGSGQKRLTGKRGFGDFYPSWSPDGTKLLFSHCTEAVGLGFFSRCDIDVMSAAGGHAKTLLSSGRWLNTKPEYSPDGSRIVFAGDRGGLQGAIWVMKADGSSPRRLTKPSLRASWPDWAPSGERIVFADNCCVVNSNLWTVKPDGSGLRKLTHVSLSEGNAVFPSYSPDGLKLSLLYDKGCPEGFCKSFATADADGANISRVTTGQDDTVVTAWGPEPTP